MFHPPAPTPTPAAVIDALRASGKPLHEWGRAVDGTPLLAARTGGEQQPAIFITAGSHAPETAGVHAALNLLRMLDTKHETHVLPLRDPLGFSGVNHALSFALGQPVAVPDYTAALEFLRTHGELLRSEETLQLFLLVQLGFMWDTPQPGYERIMSM